jgi:hypothetical protein
MHYQHLLLRLSVKQVEGSYHDPGLAGCKLPLQEGLMA